MHHHHHHDGAEAPHLAAPNASELNPGKDTACTCDAGRAGDQENKHPNDTDFTAVCKRLATVQAELALRGYELLQAVGGPLLVLRWDGTRVLADLAAAEAFAVSLGVRQ